VETYDDCAVPSLSGTPRVGTRRRRVVKSGGDLALECEDPEEEEDEVEILTWWDYRLHTC
jgi:hypothetical protein